MAARFFGMFDHFVDTKRYRVKRYHTGIRLKPQILLKYLKDNLRQDNYLNKCIRLFIQNYCAKNLVPTIASIIIKNIHNEKYKIISKYIRILF